MQEYDHPIAVMTGSANLTFSGSNLNDESINHTTSNNKSQYESVLANARTTLKDAESLILIMFQSL